MFFLYLIVELSLWAVFTVGCGALKTVQVCTFAVGLQQLLWGVSLKQMFECVRKVSKT